MSFQHTDGGKEKQHARIIQKMLQLGLILRQLVRIEKSPSVDIPFWMQNGREGMDQGVGKGFGASEPAIGQHAYGALLMADALSPKH